MSVAENAGAQILASRSWQVAPVHSVGARRDEHLRSPDFFDVEEFPEIAFRAEALEPDGDDRRLRVPCELTIRDVTRPVQLDGAFQGGGAHADGGERIAFALRGLLDRTDFSLVWNRALETGGMLAPNSVELAFDVSAVRAQ
jgi:polyisoprenoid-binding protein YceI